MERPETLSSLLTWARRELSAAGIDDAAMDARVLVSGVLDLASTDFLVNGDRPVDDADFVRVRDAVARRKAREPGHRILGQRSFYGLTLKLSADTLEPRPDTEVLVDKVLPHLRRIIAERGTARILDLGTGTGAIVLALLAECPQAVGTGVDLAAGAVRMAQENAVLNGLDARFTALESDWFSAVEGRFDIIVSNPPYI